MMVPLSLGKKVGGIEGQEISGYIYIYICQKEEWWPLRTHME